MLILQVGSQWDGKESVFRNYGGILGVWDEPVAALRLNTGSLTMMTITWEDPLGVVSSVYGMKLESSWVVSFHKPKLDHPLRPGVWSVKLKLRGGGAHHDTELMSIKFLVVPMTHKNGEPMESPQSVNAAKKDLDKTARSNNNPRLIGEWLLNVSKSGANLQEWVDSLVGQYWSVGEYCRLPSPLALPAVVGGGGENGGSRCASWVPDCVSKEWSTFSPDPKSEIREIQSNGRIR